MNAAESAVQEAPAAPVCRLLDACPRCGRTIPPDQEGVFAQEHVGRRRIVHRAWWCSFCETFWVVRENRPWSARGAVRSRRGGGAAVRYTLPRPARSVEARIAHRAIFRRRGLAAPVD